MCQIENFKYLELQSIFYVKIMIYFYTYSSKKTLTLKIIPGSGLVGTYSSVHLDLDTARMFQIITARIQLRIKNS